MDRRDFLRNGMRSFIFGGLAVMSGVFIYRNNTTEETCTFKNMCKDCKSLEGCTLPEGLKYKQDKK